MNLKRLSDIDIVLNYAITFIMNNAIIFLVVTIFSQNSETMMVPQNCFLPREVALDRFHLYVNTMP